MAKCCGISFSKNVATNIEESNGSSVHDDTCHDDWLHGCECEWFRSS